MITSVSTIKRQTRAVYGC